MFLRERDTDFLSLLTEEIPLSVRTLAQTFSTTASRNKAASSFLAPSISMLSSVNQVQLGKVLDAQTASLIRTTSLRIASIVSHPRTVYPEETAPFWRFLLSQIALACYNGFTISLVLLLYMHFIRFNLNVAATHASSCLEVSVI